MKIIDRITTTPRVVYKAGTERRVAYLVRDEGGRRFKFCHSDHENKELADGGAAKSSNR
jgi:hypothetical protein